MRKIMICLAASLITLTAGSAFAQDVAPTPENTTPSNSGLQVGVVGMVNFNTLSYSSDNDDAAKAANDMAGYKLGFGGGLRAIYEFTPLIGIQPEVLFKQYGASTEMDMGPLGKTDSNTTMNYVQVPLLARIAIPVGGGAITPKVVVGPTFSYFLSGSQESDGNSKDIEGDDVNKLDIGAAAGLGADINMGPGSLSLDLRYDRSFTNTIAGDQGEAMSAVNTGFSFLIGYNYAL